jgi:hypothetical protein
VAIPLDWRPLSERHGGEPYDEALYDGVPPHLASPLIGWLEENVSDGMAQIIALRLHLDTQGQRSDDITTLVDTISPHPDLMLDAIDLALLLADDEDRYAMCQDLEGLLVLGGSLWRVANDGQSLERRVDQTATHVAAMLAAQETSSAPHLSAAWQNCYGRNPNPSRAYSECIKAVEAAAIPLVSPSNAKATLGTVIRDLEASQVHWQLAIVGSDGSRSIAAPLVMLRLLWQGQSDRHGGMSPTVAPSQAAAEMAVHLAITLAQWFQTKGIQRLP